MSLRCDEGADESLGVGWVVDEIACLNRFVGICFAGLHHAADATGALHIVRQVDSTLGRPDRFGSPAVFEKELRKATDIEVFAKKEWDEGFPYLYALATVRLWTIMESAIDELVLDVVRLRPNVRQFPAIQKLKGPLVSFMSSSPEEQAEYLVTVLKEDVRASLQPGIGRFEAILSVVGLGGAVLDEVRRAFLELSEVRHVLVHRRGKADAKLVKQRCPWLPFKVGDDVKIRASEFDSFCLACDWYVLELDKRIIQLDGGKQRPEEAELQATVEKKVCEGRKQLREQ